MVRFNTTKQNSVAYCAISIVGIIGNLAVLAVVAKSPQMRTLTNQFIANLAVADLLVNILCVPFTLVANLYPGKNVSFLIYVFVAFPLFFFCVH